MLNKQLRLQSTERLVLGVLMSKLDWLNDPLIKIEIDDFDSLNHKIIFSIIQKLAEEGNQTVNTEHLLLLMRDHPAAEKITDLIDIVYLDGLKARAQEIQPQTFLNDVSRLNKLHALRSLSKKGINVDLFFEENGVTSQSLSSALDMFTLEEIFNSYKTLIAEVEDSMAAERTKTYSNAGDGIEDLLQELFETPRVGTLLNGEIFNSVTRGARFGKLYLNSAPSGGGKTRILLGNACDLAMPYLDEKGNIVYKKEGYEKVLFIPTEQDVQEIQLMILAHVSGVDEESIQAGLSTMVETDLAKLQLAIQIMKKYQDNFHIEQIADPNIAILKNKILKHINKNKIQYLFYDYIFSSPNLMQEFARTNTREDVALMYMANTLKEIATSYDIFVMTATQLNSDWNKPVARNSNMLRGSKAIADKVDMGTITVRVTQEEMLKVRDIVDALGCDAPNLVTDVYKNRAGSLTDVKIFRYFDYSTCRITDLFLTNGFHELITDYRIYREETYIEDKDGKRYTIDEETGEKYELT